MKLKALCTRIAALSLAVSLFLLSSIMDVQSVKAQTFKIMSYNVRNAKGLDDKTDYARVAKVITQEAPDVCAIQELDYKTKRSKGVDVLGELARLSEMTPSYGPAIDYQGGQYGIGVLTKEKPIKVEFFPLPGREEQRCLLLVEMERFVFCCSHWSLTREDRDATVSIVTEKMREQKKPVFICGDFNASPTDDAIKNLQKDWTILSADEFTFPANEPSIRIDYVCVADPTGATKAEDWLKAVKSAKVVPEPVASDHRPITVELDATIFKK